MLHVAASNLVDHAPRCFGSHALTEHDDRCSVLTRIYRTQDVTMHVLVLTKLSLHRWPAAYPCEQMLCQVQYSATRCVLRRKHSVSDTEMVLAICTVSKASFTRIVKLKPLVMNAARLYL
jgi:hypothetical protein